MFESVTLFNRRYNGIQSYAQASADTHGFAAVIEVRSERHEPHRVAVVTSARPIVQRRGVLDTFVGGKNVG